MEPQRTQPVVTRFLAKRLWSSTTRPTLAASVAFQRRAYNRASVLVRAYYAVGVLFALQAIGGWPRYAGLQQASPQWPAAWWFDWFSVRTSVNLIFTGYLAASIAAVALPERRWARATYAFTLLQYMAFVNGFDKINHNQHSWLYVGAILIFLPRGPWQGRTRKLDRQYFLTVFWSAQLVVLFFYSLSGMWKIYFAFKAFFEGRIGGFSFGGFSYIVANRILQGNEDTVLGDFFVHHEIIGWALFISTMYMEGASILHRVPAAAAPRVGCRPHPVPLRDPAGHGILLSGECRPDGPAVRVFAVHSREGQRQGSDLRSAWLAFRHTPARGARRRAAPPAEPSPDVDTTPSAV